MQNCSSNGELSLCQILWDWTNFLANTVWLNKQVKIDKRTIFYPEWFNRDVKFVNDFVNDDGSFLTVYIF